MELHMRSIGISQNHNVDIKYHNSGLGLLSGSGVTYRRTEANLQSESVATSERLQAKLLAGVF